MSTSLVMFLIVDSIIEYLNLNSASDFYTGLNFGRDYILERTIQLPPHRNIKITAQILLEDSWIGNQNTFKRSIQGSYFCGNGIYPEKWFDLSWESEHHNSNVTLKISSDLNEDPVTESWGFKNFKIYYAPECFSFYTECNYQGTEYIFCPRTPLESQEEFILPIKSMKLPAGRILYLQDPNFYGGVMKKYQNDQSCIDPFSFPKQLVMP